MSVKTRPTMSKLQQLEPTLRERVWLVVQLVTERGSKPTRIEDAAEGLRVGYQLAWAALDAAWNCGLITKVKDGPGCWWIHRARQGLLIDVTRQR